MTCKEYKNRDIVYHCKAQRDGDRYVCECGLDEPYTRTGWDDLTQEQRDKAMYPELEDFALTKRTTGIKHPQQLQDIEQPLDWMYGGITPKPSGAHKFYLVFNPQQSAPKYQHKTLEEAKAEAKRIAAKYPKQKVYVLETIACFTASVDVQEVGLS